MARIELSILAALTAFALALVSPGRLNEAFGVLNTLQIAPLAGTNGVGDLSKELAYLGANSGFAAMQLVPGTEPFRPSLVGAILGA
jgi:hypothetical protein